MNRRDLLKDAAGIPRPEAAPVIERITAVPTAGSPRQYRAGSCVLVEDARAWLCRDDVGFYAIDAHCPHLGCVVRPTNDGFICPCHQSHFDALGSPTLGSPASAGLRFLYVELDEAESLVIRRTRTTDPRDRLMA